MSQEEIVQFSQEDEMMREPQEITYFLSVSSNEVKLTSKGSSYFVYVDSNCDSWELVEPSTDKVSVVKKMNGFNIISETNDEFDNVEFVVKSCNGDFSETIKVYQKKYTYIKHSVKGFYVVLYDELDENLYNNIGTTWSDFNANKWVLLSDEQLAFKSENPNAKIHEVFTMTLDPINERTIEQAKEEMLGKIDRYDQSSDVNGFFINSAINAWFTVQERTNYKSSIDAAKLMGVETLSFYVGDVMLNIAPTMAEQMLAQIQLYADQCFIVTKQHKAAVEALETMEEVDNYNYMIGYPEKLNFILN